jgi:hypothetical protein
MFEMKAKEKRWRVGGGGEGAGRLGQFSVVGRGGHAKGDG